ncbi:unnamed protein product [Effrenium voratum]|nr:unnamed protein product [Effrenium voratum]
MLRLCARLPRTARCAPARVALRSFSAKTEEKKVPPETPEQVTRKLQEQRDYWEEKKKERSKVNIFFSRWGGILFFGFWCLVAWLGKKWGDYEMYLVERELEKPRRRRRAEE